MRKRLLCLALLVVMILPVTLASCSTETEIVDTAAAVYTLCCITGETTTPEAITAVEYEINRTLFYRIGSIVKLEFCTADEYLAMIQQKEQDVKDYLEGTLIVKNPYEEEEETSGESAVSEESAESSLEETTDETADGSAEDTSAETSEATTEKKSQSLVNTAFLSPSAKAAGYTAMSGEAILDDLANGIEIELACPRLDMYLVTDYESYLELAEAGELTALDTTLSNEAKAIKSYVHSIFFSAAKVGNKTYGVPCNTSIGEYTYIVFDTDVLKESGFAVETLYSMEDLEDYLAYVKENVPDVVPLANSVTPSNLAYMFEDGFAAYVNSDGYVRSTYDDDTAYKYFCMISRYKTLGYYQNDEGKTSDDADVRCAVEFISGTVEEMKAYAQETGCTYNQCSVPVATSENTIDCIWVVSSLCPSSWVTDVMEILTELYTDEDLQNDLLYGIENENYVLEGGQVVRLNQNYIMSPNHTGNCFIAYTDKDAGDSVDKWTNARNQNIDAVQSRTIGFTYTPTEYSFGTILDEEGEETDYIVSEPDYIQIMEEIIRPYYEKIMSGEAITFDYAAEYAAAEEIALADIKASLLATYQKRLEVQYTDGLEDKAVELYGDQLMKDAEAQVKEDVMNLFQRSSYQRNLKNAILDDLEEEHSDWSEEKLEEECEKLMEDDDYVYENYRTLVKKQSLLDNARDSYYSSALSEKVEELKEKILSSKEYVNALNSIQTSEKFVEELNYSIEVYVADTVATNLDNAITELLKEYASQMIAECESALTEAVQSYVDSYVEASTWAYHEAIYAQIKDEFGSMYKQELEEAGYTGEELQTKLDEKLEERTQTQMQLIETNCETTVIKLENALKKQITADYGELSDEDLATHLSAAETKFDETYLSLYATYYNAKALALYNIGFTDRSQIKKFGTEEETTEDETSTDETSTDTDSTGEDDEPTPDENGNLYTSYYEFVIAVKCRARYYAQFGTPQ